MPLSRAEKLKGEYETLLETHHLDILPYEEGKEAGLVEGEKKGYRKGYDAGRRAGYESGRLDGHQTGYNAGRGQGLEDGRVQADTDTFWKGAGYVLEYLSKKRDELFDEMKYEAHLVERRRYSLRDMIALIDDVDAACRQQTVGEATPQDP